MAIELPATAGAALGRLSRAWHLVADWPARRGRAHRTDRTPPVRTRSKRGRWAVGHVPFNAPDIYVLTSDDVEADLTTHGWL